MAKPIQTAAAGKTFLRHNVIYFTGTMAVSVLNYLYYPVMGRLMAPAAFGEAQATISLFLQIGVFLQVLGLVTIAVIKRYPEAAVRYRVMAELEQAALMAGLVLTLVVFVASAPLSHFLNFDSPAPLLALAISVLICVPSAFSNAYLQGFSRFKTLSISNLITAGLKLVASAALVVIGWGAFGAVFGLVVAQTFTLIYARRQAAKLGVPPLGLRLRWPHLPTIRPELRYAGLVLVTALSINVLLSIDIIAVKHYFQPHDAGLYAGIATIARIIFFVTGPLAMVLIAAIKLDAPAHNQALLKRSLLLFAGLGGGVLAVFAVVPKLVLRLMMGPQYLTYAGLLPLLALAIFVLSLANLLIYYHVALHHIWVAPAALLGLATSVGLILWCHTTIVQIITDILGAGVVTIVLVGAGVLWQSRTVRLSA